VIQQTREAPLSGLVDRPTTPRDPSLCKSDRLWCRTTPPAHSTSTATGQEPRVLSRQLVVLSSLAATSPLQTRLQSQLWQVVSQFPSPRARPTPSSALVCTPGSLERLRPHRSPLLPTTLGCQRGGPSPIPERLCPPAQLLSVSFFYPYSSATSPLCDKS
jgi:hypothetical protein